MHSKDKGDLSEVMIMAALMRRGEIVLKPVGDNRRYDLVIERAGAVRLRDVLFLCHAKPTDKAQAALWKRLVENKLAVPDTWEVSLSAGKDKAATFTRLIKEGNLGYLALLRNLRNMVESGVDHDLIKNAIIARRNGAEKVLPFRFVAAARACPAMEPAIDQALCETILASPVLPGTTVVLVDVSRSMLDKLSGKSDLSRMDAAAALASMIHGDRRVFTFSDDLVEVPARNGMAAVDAIRNSQRFNGTALFDAVHEAQQRIPAHDRMIVITDEQATGAGVLFGSMIQGVRRTMPAPACQNAYVINVASAKNGVGYGPWTHIDGFSEAVLRFIIQKEAVRP